MATLIFLAGGIGSRMGSSTPKQFIHINRSPLALYSYNLLTPHVSETIVVCDPLYQHYFPSALFALPGPRRQDSVYSALLKSTQPIILIHDSARPFPDPKLLPLLLEAVHRTGAAALAAPVTSTIKQCTPTHLVEKTLDRSTLWELQTPQALRRDLLFRAFDHIHRHNLTVTDDLSLAEAINHPAEIVPSTSRNFKVTTPSDLLLAQALCATN